MENAMIGKKYTIIDTLYSSELQSIYVVKDESSSSLSNLVMSEFKDPDIIYGIKDTFVEDNKNILPNFVESFFAELSFYIVSKIPIGATLEDFLRENSLRLTDKMYLAENLLAQMAAVSNLKPAIKYALCDFSNISVTNRKNLSFNNVFMLNRDTLKATEQDVLKRLGDMLYCIFTNSIAENPGIENEGIPPAIASIIQKCGGGRYNNINEVVKDFKSSLLYSTFIGNASIDSQIRRNFKRAQRRQSLSTVKKAAAIVVIAALIGAGGLALIRGHFWNDRDKATPTAAVTPGKNQQDRNNKPLAKFSLSNNKVFAGDEVEFLSQSSDPDLKDSVKGYSWSIMKDGKQVLTSEEQSIKYKFEQSGNYSVSLVVLDSEGEASDAYICSLQVAEKQQIPAGVGSANNNKNDRK